MKECNYKSGKSTVPALAFAAFAACAIIVIPAHASASRFIQNDRGHAPASALSRQSRNPARLIVLRTPNFGTFLWLKLSIDGVPVASLQLSERYETLLSPGQHVLSVNALPNRNGELPTETRLNAKEGQTYVFTASFDSRRVVLHRSSISGDTLP